MPNLVLLSEPYGVLMRIADFVNTHFRYFLIAGLIAFAGSDAIGQKVKLRSQINPECTSASTARFADIYAEGNIAVQGSFSCRGAFIYDISNPEAPVLASHYNPVPNQQFLEAVVVGNRGYFGSGFGEGGVHIVDLSNPYSPVLLGVVNSANGGGFNRIHEMNVFGSYLIENFNGTSNGIIKIIDVTNPAAAVLKWDFNPQPETVWVHAMHIRGNRLFTSGWGNSGVRAKTGIYDISSLATRPPTLLGFIEDTTSSAFSNDNNIHSSWTSEDGNYLYSCREVGNPDLRVYDIRDPAVPLLVRRINMGDLGLNAVAPHNPVVMGNYLYISWYQAGLQVFDISNPANPVRVGQYDTFERAFAPPAEERRSLLESEPWDIVCGSENRQNLLPTTYDGLWAVFPFLGQDKVLVGDLQNGLFILDARSVSVPLKNRVSDFDGDGRTDLSVFRAGSGDWQIETSSNSAPGTTHFGLAGDVIVPGDYDGDNRSDLAVFRPSTGIWYLQRSTAGFAAAQFGVSGDVPVAADYDADGKTDMAVWRPSSGIWYIQQSTLGFKAQQWGINGDKAITGDFEGDGKADIAIWRPSNGFWYVLQSSSSIGMYENFGLASDRPLSGDFDGNGVTDFAVYRPSTGIWYSLDPITRAFRSINFGLSEDIPIPADYDGDSKTDIAVFRPSVNQWYRLNSSDNAFFSREFGQSGDRPSPSSIQPQ